MKYYLSDYDWVFSWNGKQMFLCGKTGSKPVSGSPDPMWSGLSESDAKYYSERMPF